MRKSSQTVILLILCVMLIFSFNGVEVSAEQSGKELTILFTHDLHDHFLPAKDELNGVKYKSGGYARLQSAIRLEKDNNPEVLLLDAGDFSMGTPFQTIFDSESPGLRIMGEMGYDVVTLGNHEYDYRAIGLAESLNAAKKTGSKLPQIVQSNVIFPTDQNGNLTSSLTSLQLAYEKFPVKDYTVVEKNSVRIGIFGLMGVDAASKAPMSEVKFADPIEEAKRVVKILKEQENVDLIVCLSHSGTWIDQEKSEDEILAQQVPDINVIISGHTHRKLPEPIVVGKTIIGSTQDSARHLGIMKISQNSSSGWDLNEYRLQQINEQLPDDPYILQRVNAYKELVQDKYFSHFNLNFDQVLAVSPFSFLPVSNISDKHNEDPLGNLISDAYRYAVKKAEGEQYTPVDVAIVPVGTIRGSFFQGEITTADVFSVSSLGIGPDRIPGYPLISVYLTGEELRTVCEVDASVSPIMDDAQLFMSGMNFTFNPNRLIFNKVTESVLQKPDGTLEQIDDNRLYRVVAGLYSAQMLSVVGDKSFGLLSIVPKTKDGIPITDFEAQIIRDIAGGNNSEVKEWQAIAQYLQSFNQTNGVSEIPDYYNKIHGRKIVEDNPSIPALVNNPNKIALTVYAVVFSILALIAFMVFKFATRKTRLQERLKKQQM